MEANLNDLERTRRQQAQTIDLLKKQIDIQQKELEISRRLVLIVESQRDALHEVIRMGYQIAMNKPQIPETNHVG
jgi:septal ring factor EnvC (AmiA/AmiB activator)